MDEKADAPPASVKGTLGWLFECMHNSWMKDLEPDPEEVKHKPNKTARQVRSGHYVRVWPTPLESPYLVSFSQPMASELGLSKDECLSQRFLKFFSGDLEGNFSDRVQSWATPYALSIYGSPMKQNCPFGTGNGYGDGRAISLAEVNIPQVDGSKLRWEMQLKGAGTTPWCRGADGRAVLRSSVREFLASEAMHNMGVSTTRALSLIASKTETVQRPWYKDGLKGAKPAEDPKDNMFSFFQHGGRQPDIMQWENCAITCRVAPSFLRVGHLELFSRRAMGMFPGDKEIAVKQLELLLRHGVDREFQGEVDTEKPISDIVVQLLPLVGKRLAKMAADWIRVGYTQSNFNSDNTLIAGRTMDYGPFGFVENYNRDFCMWTGGGKKFGFMNQTNAAHANFLSLTQAVVPLLKEEHIKVAQEIVNNFPKVAKAEKNEVFRRKLGLTKWTDEASTVWDKIEDEMHDSKGGVDYTIFYRQLAELVPLAQKVSEGIEEADGKESEGEVVRLISPALYGKVENEGSLVAAVQGWIGLMASEIKNELDPREAVKLMKSATPKYIPREWMLVKAYHAAIDGDNSLVEELQELFLRPFDEQPLMEGKYYCRAPDGAKLRGGTGFMT